MNTIRTYWQMDTTALFIIAGIWILFFIFKGWKHATGIRAFFMLQVLLVVCFFSPLSVLSKYYLFSAHMAVHVLLLLIGGPLLLLSLFPQKSPAWLRALARRPILCWLAGVGIMWLWHIPRVFNAMMQWQHHASLFNGAQFAESSSLLLAGALFCLPVFAPGKEVRLPPLGGVIYLFSACLGCSVLGILITFAPAGLYHHYLAMHDVWQLNETIASQWGISKGMDQQAAGLIMWVPCCLLYVLASLYLVVSWLNKKEHSETPVTPLL